jgi:hypothetical protein
MSAVAVSVSSDTKVQSENEDVSCQELDVVFGDHRRTPHTYVVSVPNSHVINWQNVLWIRILPAPLFARRDREHDWRVAVTSNAITSMRAHLSTMSTTRLYSL